MLSHRAHNDTLLHQANANRLNTEANIKHTQAADQWGFFQAKNIRNHEYEVNLRMIAALSKDPAMASEREALEKDLRGQLKKYKTELPEMKDKAEGLVEEAKKLEGEAEKAMGYSEKAHHRADRFDWGELAVELAVVLCSVAVLTKQPAYWYSGIGIGAIGALIALSAFLLG